MRTGVLVIAMATLIVAVVTSAPGGAAQRTQAEQTLTSLTLSSAGSDGRPLEVPSTQAAMAHDGRYVAFESGTGPGQEPAIHLRDIVRGTTTLLSDSTAGAATAPDISADGRLVSYQQNGDVYVADRQPNGSALVRQVTGTARDLAYQHAPPCQAQLGAGRITPCGPRLSADGTTLVYPAALSPESPGLTVTATRGEGTAHLSGDLLDFTAFPSGPATVRYANAGSTPVPLTGLTVAEPTGSASGEPFELDQTSCTGTLAPGSSCTASVSYDAEACGGDFNAGPRLVAGRLITHSPEPAGQDVLELAALCDPAQTAEPPGLVTAAYRTAAPGPASCPAPPSGLALAAAPALTSDSAGAPLADAGGAEIGRPRVIWLRVSIGEEAEGPAAVVFAAANDDCGIQLVNPARLQLAGPLPAGAPPACSQGEQLTSTASCTAYLLISPDAVAPEAALLGIACEQPFLSSSIAPVAYVTAQGVSHVIVARHARGGAAGFAASASTVVSVTSQGAGFPGAVEPSVSANGRYVAFAAPAPLAASGQPAAGGASQVWLRDTGRGVTTLVSCLPPARPGPCLPAADADSPSVSGDGQQVAFATAGAVNEIYVRSVPSGHTVLISADSYAPAIAQDGSTVAYVSRPAAAGPADLYLAPTSGRAVSELASGPAGTAIGMPSLDAIGRLATFPADGALLPNAPPGITSVYTFDRFPRLSPAPSTVGFGSVFIDSGTRAVPVTVSDSGPGPGTVTGVVTTGPFRVTGNRCAGAILSAGGRCAVTVTFAPALTGQASGLLTVTTQDDGEPPVAVTVPVTATVPAPRVTAVPGVASSGAAVLVLGSGFPPGQAVTLSWQPGLGSAVTTAAGSGTFSAYLVIFPHDVLGPRTLTATVAARALASDRFLVQRSPAEPPFYSGVMPP